MLQNTIWALNSVERQVSPCKADCGLESSKTRINLEFCDPKHALNENIRDLRIILPIDFFGYNNCLIFLEL